MPRFNLVEFATALKAGARHGVKDKQSLQKAHDHVSEMVDCCHCSGAVEKANARHSKADMGRIKQAHDLLVELGAECGTKPELPMGTMPGTGADISDLIS